MSERTFLEWCLAHGECSIRFSFFFFFSFWSKLFFPCILTFLPLCCREYLTGFHKRKVERKKAAIEEIKKRLKEEQKKLREEVQRERAGERL